MELLSAEDVFLLVLSATAFLGVGAWGWAKPKLWLWRWADVVYYPLAALGIVLLFLSNDINRTLLKIEANRTATEEAWRARANPQPNVELQPTPAALLSARFDWFASVRSLGEVCEGSTTPGCGAHSEHARAIKAVFGEFAIPRTEDPVALARAEDRFCRAGLAYVDRLAEDSSLSLGAFDRLKTALGQLSKGGDEAMLKAALARNIAHDRQIFDSMSDAHERAIAEPFISVQSEHAVVLLGQLSWCASRDDRTAEGLKTLDAWQAEEQNRARTRAKFARDLQAAKDNKTPTPIQQNSRKLQQQLWPYILVLALSIKFGKAISAVADDLTKAAKRLLQVGKRARHLVGISVARLRRRRETPPAVAAHCGEDTDPARSEEDRLATDQPEAPKQIG